MTECMTVRFSAHAVEITILEGMGYRPVLKAGVYEVFTTKQQAQQLRTYAQRRLTITLL